MPPIINLYAEFLLNIRQVTIYATLEDDQKSDSDVLISSDTKTLTVKYEDAFATITFPSGILGTAKVEFPMQKRKVISLRLEISEDDKPSHGIGMDVGNDSPWPASSLSPTTKIACRSCQKTIVSPSARIWKDLPREHWAELMDLWHCHKPHTGDTDSSATVSKGYSAQNRPRLKTGLGFVDTGHVFVSASETLGVEVCVAAFPQVKVAPTSPWYVLGKKKEACLHLCDNGIVPDTSAQDQTQLDIVNRQLLLNCSGSPHIQLLSFLQRWPSPRFLMGLSQGVVDEGIGGFKFYKWAILLRKNQNLPWEQNAVQNFICAQLLGLIESQATKKFIVYAGNLSTSENSVLLWAFNPDLKYSASFLHGGQPRRAMKILYKPVHNPLELLSKDDSIEELRFPEDVVGVLKADLKASNAILPPGAQALQDWQVALLDRFESTNGIILGDAPEK